MTGTRTTLPAVKAQYEELPYPARDPQEEKLRLLQTSAGNLVSLNHHCFAGKKDFRSGFRCLVAGGGTGDCTIFLAEQLRDFDAEIVYLDFSESSRRIAEERARIRGLTNISWVTDSIMKIPQLQLGEFDFINCTGVLHHLASTEAGLAALKEVLAVDGAMCLMLYARYGRRSVYEMQSLLQMYLPENADIEEKIRLTRELIEFLPDTNTFKRDFEKVSDEIATDIGLFDLLLHSQDRCFSVAEIYDLAGSADLNVMGFTAPYLYDPAAFSKKSYYQAHIDGFDSRKSNVVGELLRGDLAKHEFYLGGAKNCTATIDDENNSLVAIGGMISDAPKIAEAIVDRQMLNYRDAYFETQIPGNSVSKAVFSNLDGRLSIREIIDKVRSTLYGSSRDNIRLEVERLYRDLNSKGYVCLLEKGNYGVMTADLRKLRHIPTD